MDENAFHRPCNFKELRVVKKAHIATCALCACWQPLDRIGRTNISTGQRPTELFRTRLIHRWRSWLHLQSHRFGIRTCPRCGCRLATFGALPTPSTIEPIIMLTDHPTLAPHRQVRHCHRSIHCWHGHAARRSALPRERFSPL